MSSSPLQVGELQKTILCQCDSLQPAQEQGQHETLYFCRPYDTLEEVLGLRGKAGIGNLNDWGISYREIGLTDDGSINFEGLQDQLQRPGLLGVKGIGCCDTLLLWSTMFDTHYNDRLLNLKTGISRFVTLVWRSVPQPDV